VAVDDVSPVRFSAAAPLLVVVFCALAVIINGTCVAANANIITAVVATMIHVTYVFIMVGLLSNDPI
jgi:hypothetical protein